MEYAASVPVNEMTVGPARPPVRRSNRRQFAEYLAALPSAEMCEKSLKQQEVVTHVAILAHDFLVTGSKDGCVSFWKKGDGDIERVVHYKSHNGPIEGLAVSGDGLLFCTISNTEEVMIHATTSNTAVKLLELTFTPGAVQWVHKHMAAKAKLAISDRNSSLVHIYDGLAETDKPIISNKIHGTPVKVMRYNHALDAVVSADTVGFIEYWDPSTLKFPKSEVKFKYKSDTDLFEIVKCKTVVSAIEVSKDGKQFAVTSPDRNIRVFWYMTGKLRWVYDASRENAGLMQRHSDPLYQLEAIEFARRIEVEKEIENTEDIPQPNAVFDESSNFIIYPTLLGIKIVNLHTNEVARILGKAEKNKRFLSIALFQESLAEPILLCCAFKKHRIFMFSRKEPR